jgi:hypothetical protein
MSVATKRTALFGGSDAQFSTVASPGADIGALFTLVDSALTTAGWTHTIITAGAEAYYYSTGESGTETLWLHVRTGAMGTASGTNLSGGSYLLCAPCQYIDGSGNQWNQMGGVNTANTGAGYQSTSAAIEFEASLTWDFAIVADKNSIVVWTVPTTSHTTVPYVLMAGVLERPVGVLGKLVTTADYTFLGATDTNVTLTVGSSPIAAGYQLGDVVEVVSQQAGPGGTTLYFPQYALATGVSFTYGETLTGSSSGATGTVVGFKYACDSTNSWSGVALTNVVGTFNTSDKLTGGTSGLSTNPYTVASSGAMLGTIRQGAKIMGMTSTTITLDRLDRMGNVTGGNKVLAGALVGEDPQPYYATTRQGTAAWNWYYNAASHQWVTAPVAGLSIGGAQPNSWTAQVHPSASSGASNTANTGNAFTLPTSFNPSAPYPCNDYSDTAPNKRTNSLYVSTATLTDPSNALAPGNFWRGYILGGLYRSARATPSATVPSYVNRHANSGTAEEWVCVWSTTQEMWMGPFPSVNTLTTSAPFLTVINSSKDMLVEVGEVLTSGQADGFEYDAFVDLSYADDRLSGGSAPVASNKPTNAFNQGQN